MIIRREYISETATIFAQSPKRMPYHNEMLSHFSKLLRVKLFENTYSGSHKRKTTERNVTRHELNYKLFITLSLFLKIYGNHT